MTRPDERRWREERAVLNERRAALGERASGLYPDAVRVGSTSLLCRPEWIPAEPVPLARVAVRWTENAVPPVVTGAQARLPEGYGSYSQAMGALARPTVFEDRPAYRLLAAGLRGDDPALDYAEGHYFAGVDVGEAVAHELAAEVAGLPLRAAVGDPCDLPRRVALTAVTTVTIRRRARDVVLHWRDPAKVAHAGGLYQVMPVGVFQPAVEDDPGELDLWRCMVREYHEEFLGGSEEYGAGFAYDTWPFFRRMSGDGVRAYCLGLGVDPLTMAVDLLTAVVVDDDVFADLFGARVDVNAEGRVMTAPFDGRPRHPMQPAGAAALELAWRHRAALLVQ
ncbi:MAG TPA: hypothetical protein VHJ17_06290 [Thermomonospora sp.]|nr:hypothetical protein [Thermomonospora sp.]